MYEELHEKSVKADKYSLKRLGSLPLCIALGCDDIGTATIDGKKVYVTFGRNLDRKQQAWFLEKTGFQPIWVSADDGSCELILPDDDVEKLLPLLI